MNIDEVLENAFAENPIPWKLDYDVHTSTLRILDVTGKIVVWDDAGDDVYALIVRAVNSFKAMRETAFRVSAYIEATHGHPSSEQLTDMLTHAKAAMALSWPLSEKGK